MNARWPRLRFEASEEGSAHTEAERYSYTPTLGVFHALTSLKSTGNIEAAQAVGKAIAEKAKAIGITQVAFDRSGFKYHGRVKALADAARENGLQF